MFKTTTKISRYINLIYLSIAATYSIKAISADLVYTGELIFKAETNISQVYVQGKTNKFQTLKIEFKEKKPSILNVEAVVDMNTLLSSVNFSNYQIYQNSITAKKTALLVMKLNGATCTSYKKGYECIGNGNFQLAKAGFTKIIKIILDEKLNATSHFTLSQKELNLKNHHYIGIEIDDKVDVYLYANHQ